MINAIMAISIIAAIFLAGVSTHSALDGHGNKARSEIHKCESTLPRNKKCVAVITAVPEDEVEK